MKKSLMENLIVCAVYVSNNGKNTYFTHTSFSLDTYLPSQKLDFQSKPQKRCRSSL